MLDFKFSNSKYTLFYLLIIFFIFFLGIFQFIPFFLNEKIINFYIPPSDIIIKSSTQELFKNFGIPTLGYDGINFNPQIFFDIFFIGSVNYIFNLDSLTNFYYIGILFPILLTLFMFSKVIEKLDIKKINYFNFFKVFCFFLILIFLTDLEMLFRIVQSSSTLYGLLFFSIIFYSCILLLQEKKNKFLIISNIILMNCILIYTKILFGLFSSYIVLITLILNKKKNFLTTSICFLIFFSLICFKLFSFKNFLDTDEFYFNPIEFNSSSKISLILVSFVIFFLFKIKKKIKYPLIYKKKIETLIFFVSIIYLLSIIFLHSSIQSLWINLLMVFIFSISIVYFYDRYTNSINLKKLNYIYFFLISSVFLDINKDVYIFVFLFLIFIFNEQFFLGKKNILSHRLTIVSFIIILIYGSFEIDKNNIVNRIISGSYLKINQLSNISLCSKKDNCNSRYDLNFKDISEIIETNKKSELQIFIPQSNLEVWAQFDDKSCWIIQSIYQAKYGIPLLQGFKPKTDGCNTMGNYFINRMAENKTKINENNLCKFLNPTKNIIIIKNKQKLF